MMKSTASDDFDVNIEEGVENEIEDEKVDIVVEDEKVDMDLEKEKMEDVKMEEVKVPLLTVNELYEKSLASPRGEDDVNIGEIYDEKYAEVDDYGRFERVNKRSRDDVEYVELIESDINATVNDRSRKYSRHDPLRGSHSNSRGSVEAFVTDDTLNPFTAQSAMF